MFLDVPLELPYYALYGMHAVSIYKLALVVIMCHSKHNSLIHIHTITQDLLLNSIQYCRVYYIENTAKIHKAKPEHNIVQHLVCFGSLLASIQIY